MLDSRYGLYIAHSEKGPISLCGRMANRHGLIAGATGTGKTISLQVLAETFSQAGVPCFMADMKGDLSGISAPGEMSDFISKRCPEFEISSPAFAGCPTQFLDVYGKRGIPLRTTISDMGPQLLSRLLSLNDTQSGVLDIVFRIADDKQLLLIDLKDLRAMLNYVGEHAGEFRTNYGNITSATIGSIQRALLSLENEGADVFFGEPAFDTNDLFRTVDGKGVMSVLAADRLMMNPKLYSSTLLWLLSELYSTLPEVGDMELPKLVFFFDEAHTLFTDTAPALVDKIEQVVRLIRSKGVGVYFVTQNPTDIPDSILGQLGNRIQHALRAFTPKEQKAVKTAADTVRPNPAFKTADAISELGTGEALVSFLDEKGVPTMVERAKILFPLSRIGAIDDFARSQIISDCPLYRKYAEAVDRQSAFEDLTQEVQQTPVVQQYAEPQKAQGRSAKGSDKGGLGSAVLTAAIGAALTSVTRSLGNEAAHAITGKKSRSGGAKGIADKAISNATSTALRKFTRGLLGSLIK
ncbi:MAG: DUF853 family protein [Bacteroidales bacterium]|nr:DUF853 family protein [Bacteroidales bacterium]